MDKPLVSIWITSYNQERYVRDAVRGLLSQTYEPLEIIISDDHSTDNTWKIIQDEVDEYKRSSGRHSNIVLNRNEKNLGIVGHCELVEKFRHGVLCVGCGGDDISLPNRVERIVEAWEASGRTATLIHHGYTEIDVEGRELRDMPPRSAEVALGATAAYSSLVFDKFDGIGNAVAVEDQVYAKRAIMFGPELRLPDVLLKYRVGSGVTSKFTNEREQLYSYAYTMAKACEQTLLDLEHVKGFITFERYDYVREMATHWLRKCDVDWRILSDLPLRQRWNAVLKKYHQHGFLHGPLGLYFNGLVYLQPRWLCDFQRKIYRMLQSTCMRGRRHLVENGVQNEFEN